MKLDIFIEIGGEVRDVGECSPDELKAEFMAKEKPELVNWLLFFVGQAVGNALLKARKAKEVA